MAIYLSSPFTTLVCFIFGIHMVNSQSRASSDASLAFLLNANRQGLGQGSNAVGLLPGLSAGATAVTAQPVATAPRPNSIADPRPTIPLPTVRPPPTTTFSGFLAGQPYPFVLPPPDIPYFGSKWNGPWGYPVGHYQAFRGTGQYITHYSYYPLSYFGSLMAPFAYGLSGKR